MSTQTDFRKEINKLNKEKSDILYQILGEGKDTEELRQLFLEKHNKIEQIIKDTFFSYSKSKQ